MLSEQTRIKKMPISLDNEKVIDSHCHFLLPEKEAKEFYCYWNLSRLNLDPKHLQNTFAYRMVLHELKSFLSDDASTPDQEILAVRNELYRSDPAGYIEKLFRAANIEAVVIDTGVPNIETYGYTISHDDFQKLLPGEVKSRCVVRIEPIIYTLLKNDDLTFQDAIYLFEHELEEQIHAQNAVALKTTIAYHTGLDVRIVTEEQARTAYDAYRKNRGEAPGEEKIIRDYFVLLSLEKCMQRDIPMQIHTGIGDAPVLNLMKSNPWLLFDLVCDPYFQQAKIVLEHLGYPYIAESGSLANMFPNIWVDFSEIIAFASPAVDRCLKELFEMTPVTKIMYGSDSYGIPEIFWFSAVHFKRCLNNVLNGFIRDSILSPEDAHYIAGRILRENARELYKVGHSSGE